jgi:hypothetical protein
VSRVQNSFISKPNDINLQLNSQINYHQAPSIDNDLFKFRINNDFESNNNVNYISNQRQQQLIDAFNSQYKQQISSPACLSVDNQIYHQQQQQQQKKPVKKTRILFSQWQINELEKLFKKQKYVNL